MLLSIFTPIYNRDYTLPKLYQSLCNQTCKDFEWIIIDDGSTDSSEELIRRYKEEGLVNIQFLKQPNGGKHRAINQGINMASGRLFMIVDSDDHLTQDAVEWISDTAKTILDDDDYAGLSGIRITPKGKKIGGGSDFGIIDTNALDIRYKYHIFGDLAEIIKTEVFQKFLFPSIDGEKFCPEALIWNRIAQQYRIRYCHRGIYICEYLPDGLTAKITKIRHSSPIGSAIYYSELTRMPIPFIQKLKGAINYWRFYESKAHSYVTPVNAFLNLIGYIPGKLMRLNDRYKGQF